jgi:hypothetical protein
MRSEFATETQRPPRFLGNRYHAVSLALFFAAVTFVLTPLRTVFSQSGRGHQPEPQKQTPGKKVEKKARTSFASTATWSTSS